jgi:hypothetical protein
MMISPDNSSCGKTLQMEPRHPRFPGMAPDSRRSGALFISHPVATEFNQNMRDIFIAN